MWENYFIASSIEEAAQVLSSRVPHARIVAGGTDLILELERGVRRDIHTLIDISRVRGLAEITLGDDGCVHLGPLVTHNQCVASEIIHKYAFPLAKACWEVGSPQIRNRGTIAGNLITASPANDTITPLMALDAQVTLQSAGGQRQVKLADFYTGVRRTVMREDEILVDISFRAMTPEQRGTFLKFALRNAQAISLVNTSILLTFAHTGEVADAAITYGAVAPTIIHAPKAEQFLRGRLLSEDVIRRAAMLAAGETRPISDVRSSAAYRKAMAAVACERALLSLAKGSGREGFPENPVLLAGAQRAAPIVHMAYDFNHDSGPIVARVNGKRVEYFGGHTKTLLRLLREDGLLTGTKEGCAEGECGACTVFLDGMAVMSCMVPAPRAHGAEVVTIEGLSDDDRLHPVQREFINSGAVQCGYCTPGFIMSAAKLLEEKPNPNRDEIKQALTGNLCRCTGYYKIIEAIERAAATGGV